MKNYHQVLGLNEDATLDEIKSAYREYAIKFHPDKHGGDNFFRERFQEIQEAYEHLKNGKKYYYNDIPQIISFELSSDEVEINSRVTISWETCFASYICISIRTTNGVEIFDELSPKGKMEITPYSRDMNVGLTITAKNNLSEVVSNKLLHLKYPTKQYRNTKGGEIIMWVFIVLITFIAVSSIIFLFFK